ncbi:transposase [Streptomyces sp. GD-15H]|uniref:transposase n=1 Tax=Streptomyces sp. GD-15H TaxID=3129112 RepID=UPI0032569AC9
MLAAAGVELGAHNDHVATQWYSRASSAGIPVIRVRFPAPTCRACPNFQACDPSKVGRGREIMLREKDAHDALQKNRAQQDAKEWRALYQHRQGIEATVSQGVRSFGLRRSRYRGQKTEFQHFFTTAAMNLARLDAWNTGTPRAATRIFRFEWLCPAA